MMPYCENHDAENGARDGDTYCSICSGPFCSQCLDKQVGYTDTCKRCARNDRRRVT